MNPNVLIYNEVDQTLNLMVTRLPTDVNWVIEDVRHSPGSAARTVASGSATVASWSTTTDAACGSGQVDARKIPVASTTGIAIGDSGVIRSADGVRETFVVHGFVTNDRIKTESPLFHNYDSGVAVEGVTITVDVPDAVCQAEDYWISEVPLRIVWSVTTGTEKEIIPVPLRLVRTGVTGDLSHPELIIRKLKVLYPDMFGRATDDTEPSLMVKELLIQLSADLLSKGIEADQFLLGDIGVQLAMAKVVAHMAEAGWSPGGSRIEDYASWAARDYRRRWEDVTIGLPGKGVQSTSTSGTSKANEYIPITLTL